MDADQDIPYGYCHCGCGRKTNLAAQTRSQWGYVKGEPVRYLRGHVNRKSPVDFIEHPDTHCWIWCAPSGGGYGYAWRNGGKVRAHCAYFEDLVGPVPKGLELDHLCRTPACVNPGHLEPVTHRVNTLRGESPPAQNARKTHCPRGHPLSGENLYRDPSGGRYCRTCRRKKDRARKQNRRRSRALG